MPAMWRLLDDRTQSAHKAWNNVILPIDDPWWQTHTPMNGWGCRCYMQYLMENQAKRMLGGADPATQTAPPIYYDSYVLSKGKITRGNSKRFGRLRGQAVNVPRGISPGFAHMPFVASNVLSPQARALMEHDNLMPKKAIRLFLYHNCLC